MFFAVALLSHVLYRRVRTAEELAARRKVDIDDLSKLNEFIIQNMGTGVLVVDGERRLRLMNQAARDLIDAPNAQPGTPLERPLPGACRVARGACATDRTPRGTRADRRP